MKEYATKQTAEKTLGLLASGELVDKLTEIAGVVGNNEVDEKLGEIVDEVNSEEIGVEEVTPVPIPSTSLTRILPDGDNDNGKGWQCSKYAWYLATGERMNYAPHLDYGPCHGADMVDYLIKTKGWKECEKKNGAIFAYNDASFGHTGVVVDASQNLVNDANTLVRPLAVETHVLDLEALGARYGEE